MLTSFSIWHRKFSLERTEWAPLAGRRPISAQYSGGWRRLQVLLRRAGECASQSQIDADNQSLVRLSLVRRH